jgi:hypothetical protein
LPGPVPKAGTKKAATKPPVAKGAPPLPPAPLTVDLAAELAKVIEAPYSGLPTRIKSLTFKWKAKGLDVQGNFYYLALRDGQPTVEEFVKLLYDHIPYFCLTQKDRQKHLDQWEKTRELFHMQDMFDKARKLLIRSKESGKTVGEPGEMILFMLLEGALKIPQMCCKMSLKTSAEMPVHGSDAIHLAFDEAAKKLVLYWGESKLYAQLSNALDEVCTSIQGFITANGGKKPRDRDVDILCDHMNLPDGPAKEAVLKYFDPYAEESNDLREVFACFVGFDFAFFDKLVAMDKAKAESEFQIRYLERVKSACQLFEQKIKSTKIHKLNFHFFLIPFPCVDTLRKLYLQKLQG